MPDERQTAYESQLKSQRTRMAVLTGVIIVLALVLAGMGAWVLRDHIRPGSLILLGIPPIVFGYAVFVVYSSWVAITSTRPATSVPLMSRFIWYHGAGAIVLCFTVFVFSAIVYCFHLVAGEVIPRGEVTNGLWL